MLKRVLEHPGAPKEGLFLFDGYPSDSMNLQSHQPVQAGLSTSVVNTTTKILVHQKYYVLLEPEPQSFPTTLTKREDHMYRTKSFGD